MGEAQLLSEWGERSADKFFIRTQSILISRIKHIHAEMNGMISVMSEVKRVSLSKLTDGPIM
jgi:hypothetical protein